MPLSIFLAALAIGAAIPLGIWSMSSARSGGGLLARTSKRGEATTDMRELHLASGASSRVFGPFVKGLAGKVRKVTPVGWTESIQRRVVLAGLEATWPAEKVIVVNAVVAVGTIVLALFVTSGLPSLPRLVLMIVFTMLGVFLPSVILDGKARRRQQEMQHELPDALDQLMMGVEAGLGFEAALKRVASAGHGPLHHEFTRVLKEMQIGVARADALRGLADRTDIEDIRTFVIAVVQAGEYGLPIVQVLRVQVDEIRVKRRQRAEEKAMRLPVKMIFPLGLCIFPALFIVLIGPGVIRVWRAIIP